MTEDEMIGWYHQLNGHGFGWTPGVGDGQGGLACCSSGGRRESDTTKRLNWTELIILVQISQCSGLWLEKYWEVSTASRFILMPKNTGFIIEDKITYINPCFLYFPPRNWYNICYLSDFRHHLSLPSLFKTWGICATSKNLLRGYVIIYQIFGWQKVFLKLQTFIMQMWNSVKFEHLTCDIRQVWDWILSYNCWPNKHRQFIGQGIF